MYLEMHRARQVSIIPMGLRKPCSERFKKSCISKLLYPKNFMFSMIFVIGRSSESLPPKNDYFIRFLSLRGRKGTGNNSCSNDACVNSFVSAKR